MKTAIERARELEKGGSWICSCHNNSFEAHIQSIIDTDGEMVARAVISILKSNLEDTKLKIQFDIFRSAGLFDEFKKFWNARPKENVWKVVMEFGSMYPDKFVSTDTD